MLPTPSLCGAGLVRKRGHDNMTRWQRMDESRRRRVIGFYRALFVSGLLLAMIGIVVAVVGLLLALVAGTWWVLWIGLGVFALGLLTWFVGSVGTFGIAQAQVDEAARHFLADRDEQETR